MGVILSDSPKLKSEIMKDSVLCCRHVLELDYLRENIDTESYKDNDDPINPFTYNIKEIPSLSEKNQKILGKYKHLLFCLLVGLSLYFLAPQEIFCKCVENKLFL